MATMRLRHEDYTVGWICALSIELIAARRILEEEHEKLTTQPHDLNAYTLGRISNHNVVLACAPEGSFGITSVAVTAVQMLRSFPRIRFALLVGIGSGVPSPKADIRLGDVVVSVPQGVHGGVVQYDLGSVGAGGSFQRTGSLNSPPRILLSAVANLRVEQELRGEVFVQLLKKATDGVESWEPGRDVLFSSTYHHVEGSSCDSCDDTFTIRRAPRVNNDPVVHYGLIASGSSVMKDGITRDRLAYEIGGVLCFEMEAAGVMNSLPCLVIRGIADYGDSHRNQSWQRYAVMTATSYAAWLLEFIPPIELAGSQDVWGLTQLHIASDEGDLALVSQLLDGGAKLDPKDNAGWTALHHAAQKGHIDIARLLLDASADSNAQDLTGNTALALAARHGHRAMVELLLSSGADDTITNSEGTSAKDLSKTFGHHDVLELLTKSTVVAQAPQDNRLGDKQRPPRKQVESRASVCGNFSARVELSIGGVSLPLAGRTVHDVVYDDNFWVTAVTELKEKADNPECMALENVHKWIHLPANNKQWVKDLIKRLCHSEGRTERECHEIIAFIDNTFYENKGPTAYTWSRMPSFQTGSLHPSTSSNKENRLDRLSLVLPYVDMESEKYLRRDNDFGNEHFEKMRSLRNEYMRTSDIYMSRTLDQSYYDTLENTDDRDHDQVVYRYTLAKRKQKDDERLQTKKRPNDPGVLIKEAADGVGQENLIQEPQPLVKILMVNQLWLWQIDRNTVITAFPERWHKGAERELINSIAGGSSATFIAPFDTFLTRFVNKCINFVEEPYWAGLDESYFNIFASSIAAVSSQEVQCYRNFSDSIALNKGKLTEPTGVEIDKEVKLLQEVKDIRDEINMLDRVLGDQKRLVSKMIRILDVSDSFEHDCGTFHHSSRLKRMDEDAERVEKSLNHLLDLKQKQSNLEEAIFTRVQAQETALQGQYILVFTIVTIVFTPLSFMAALFAIQIREFPHDSQGISFDGVWIGKYMAAGELVTIGLIALTTLILLQRGNIKDAWKRRKAAKTDHYLPDNAYLSIIPIAPEKVQAPKGWHPLLGHRWSSRLIDPNTSKV